MACKRPIYAMLQHVCTKLEEDVAGRMVDRGGGHKRPPQIQLNVYQEALLLFYGKAIVYLKGMGKPLPQQMQEWIG